MCGIAGVVAEISVDAARDLAQSMGATLAHRGPDDVGAFVTRAQEYAVALAHRRLSIIDLTPSGHQPMQHADHTISYNGEIYNYIELRDELRALGHEFRTTSDTEVLLHAYDEWGEECLGRFNGMWSFAIWNAADRTLFCSVDRSGIKPFYYSRRGDTFAFASEIKALLTLPFVPARLNAAHAQLYLLSSIDLCSDETMFAGIHRLPPGHSIRIQPGKVPVIRRWWKPGAETRPSDTDTASYVRFLLRDSVRIRFRSDVPVGITLSGGIDSSAIALTAAALNARGELGGKAAYRLRTFTATAWDDTVDESKTAERIAGLCHAEAFTTRPSSDDLFNRDLTQLVYHQDEPFSSLSTYMQFCVMRLAASVGTKVVLSGQGPDELFLGYPWHFAYAWRDQIQNGRLRRLPGEVVAAKRHTSLSSKELLGYLLQVELRGLQRLRYLYRAERFLASDVLSECRTLMRQATDVESSEALLRREVEETGLPALLRYEDRNSMAFSVESRLPYLDHRLIELAYTIPPRGKIVDGWSKYLLRAAVKDFVPADVVWSTRKIGFAAPDTEFRCAVASAIRDVMSRARSSCIVNASRLLSASQASTPDIRLMWRFLNFELWMRRFNVTI